MYFFRTLVVYPWTQRYFGNFGNLYNAAAIEGNKMVAAHGVVVIHGLERGWKNMDNIRETYSDLSLLHSEKLHVDPDNFKVGYIFFVTKNGLGCIFAHGETWLVYIRQPPICFCVSHI